MLRIKTSDNQIVEVEQYILRRSSTINDIITNNEGVIPDIIPLLDVSSASLRMIIEYYDHYRDRVEVDVAVEDMPKTVELSEYDQALIHSRFDILQSVVTDCVQLGLMTLMTACCKYIANMTNGKSLDEMRVIYQIPEDSDDEDGARGAGQNWGLSGTSTLN